MVAGMDIGLARIICCETHDWPVMTAHGQVHAHPSSPDVPHHTALGHRGAERVISLPVRGRHDPPLNNGGGNRDALLAAASEVRGVWARLLRGGWGPVRCCVDRLSQIPSVVHPGSEYGRTTSTFHTPTHSTPPPLFAAKAVCGSGWHTTLHKPYANRLPQQTSPHQRKAGPWQRRGHAPRRTRVPHQGEQSQIDVCLETAPRGRWPCKEGQPANFSCDRCPSPPRASQHRDCRMIACLSAEWSLMA